eukprot:17686-Heterococcus_DN1.PRE.2
MSTDTSIMLPYAVYQQVVNIFLLAAKIYAFWTTGSKAVAASLADSGVDILSQGILALMQHLMNKKHEDYPVGRQRLEAIGVIACSCIMSISSLEVIQFSCTDLYDGFKHGNFPEIEVNLGFYLILGGGTVAKLYLWQLCRKAEPKSDSLDALAEDHLNDVASNVAAIFTAGRSAPEEFISMVESLANEHHSSITVDCTRAYFYGSRFNVEIEIVMPEHTLLKVSHDIALDLQHKLEALSDVERAFVHVDYLHRDMPEHKVERNLLLGLTEGTESTLLLERAQSAGSTFPSAA